MDYKDFFYWIDGFMSGKVELTITDVLTIKEKMSLVKDEDLPRIFTKRGCETKNKLYGINPVEINIKKDNDLGYPPKIVM